MRPVIGISCYVEPSRWGVWDEPAAVLPMTYVAAVSRAGGRPVVLPPSDDDELGELLGALDGLILAGGPDIDPESYGAQRDPNTTEIRPDRDRFERALLGGALEADMPVLGICRGMQLLNVVKGGDLVQDLATTNGHDEHKKAPGAFGRHRVEIAPDSLLCSVLGERDLVASHHHQAPGRLGAGLKRVAWSPDDTTEAIEDPDARLLLGVLWHPEQAQDGNLFKVLVEKAGEYRKERR